MEDHGILREALNKYKGWYGWGAWRSLADISDVDGSTISRIASGRVAASLETWLALHYAAPEWIPDPGDDKPVGVPIFEPGVGGFRLEGGAPVGKMTGFAMAPTPGLATENSFYIRIVDEAMAPSLRPGDLVLVCPGLPLEHGKMCCFADRDQVTIRRYCETEGGVVLLSDHPDVDPLVIADRKEGRLFRAPQSVNHR